MHNISTACEVFRSCFPGERPILLHFNVFPAMHSCPDEFIEVSADFRFVEMENNYFEMLVDVFECWTEEFNFWSDVISS